jgi:hypothetical protein
VSTLPDACSWRIACKVSAASTPTSDTILSLNHFTTTLRFVSVDDAFSIAKVAATYSEWCGVAGGGPEGPDALSEKLNDWGESGVAIVFLDFLHGVALLLLPMANPIKLKDRFTL